MDEKKTDHWLPLWVGAYLADTQHLTRDEHGGYFLLLLAYWRNKGPLLDDDKRLASITKATPKEWKQLKPILAEFFTVADGHWTQKRMQKELATSMANLAQKSMAGKASAAKRLGSKEANEMRNARSTATRTDDQRESNPPPSPTPLPTPTTTTSSGSEPASEHPQSYISSSTPSDAGCVGFTPTPVHEICKAMETAGITDFNLSHPTLITLLKAGATSNEFLQAAHESLRKGKGFAYAIGIVVKQREAAAKLVLHQGRLPNKQEALEASNHSVGDEWAKKMQGISDQEGIN